MSEERNVEIDLDDEGPPKTVGFTGDQFDKLISAIRGNQEDRVEVEAAIHARAMKTHLSPTNDVSPQISVYNPRGERDHPRPDLKCEFFLGPYPLEKQTLLVKEIEYLNQLEPGTFEVTKGDGTAVPFHIKAKYRLDGRTVERLTIGFPCADDEQKQNYPPFTQMLHEVLDQIEVRKLTGAER